MELFLPYFYQVTFVREQTKQESCCIDGDGIGLLTKPVQISGGSKRNIHEIGVDFTKYPIVQLLTINGIVAKCGEEGLDPVVYGPRHETVRAGLGDVGLQ